MTPRGSRGSNQYQTRGVPTGDATRASTQAVADAVDWEAEQIGWIIGRGGADKITEDDITEDAPGWLLELAADSLDVGIRTRVAKHPACPPPVLSRMVDIGPSPEQLGSIDKLGFSEDAVVWNAATNPGLPVEWLHRFAVSTDRTWLRAAAANPSTPPEVLIAVIENRNTWFHAASNPSLPADAIDRLAREGNVDVRCRAAINPSIRWDTLVGLSKQPEVQSDALQAMDRHPHRTGRR